MVTRTQLDNEHEKVNKAFNILSQFHHPIFISKDNGTPYLAGTGFILDICHRRFFITAAHVANDIKLRGFFAGLPTLEFIECAFTQSKGDDADNLDIAVMEVTGQVPFNTMRGIPSTMRLHALHEKRGVFIFIGYPHSHQKKIYDRKNDYQVRAEAYYSALCSEDEYKYLNVISQSHIAINHVQKKCFDKHGDQLTFPKPQGMSGGGIWHYALGYDAPLLCGLAHSNPGQKKFFLGTRIHLVLAWINQAYGIIP